MIIFSKEEEEAAKVERKKRMSEKRMDEPLLGRKIFLATGCRAQSGVILSKSQKACVNTKLTFLVKKEKK